jgi:hypothetical protein
MKIIHEGETYHLLFKHIDNRELPKKERKRLGVATTTLTIMRETGKDEKGHWVGTMVVPPSTVRLNPIADHFNRAHGRWYALEKALGVLATTGDKRLVRALRKGYYSQVKWRPDGRDGYKIRQDYRGRRELARIEGRV